MNTMSFTSLAEQIVRENSDAIMFADHEGAIRLWNKGAEAMFGYSAAEAEGNSLDLIIPENLRGRHWEGYHKVMASGETRYGTELLSAPGIRKDGTRLSLEFSMVIVRGEDGAVLGTGAIIRDITARFQKDKALKERLKLLEEKQA
ncbi:MAG TPA: PAS domain S-box protein [Desulfuromonadales bacterium]|nr:PAS domain S-box protein [Desulfuromonadales bacterium]